MLNDFSSKLGRKITLNTADPGQELGAGLRSENGDDVATTVSRSSPLVGPPETQSVATANMPEMELVPNTRIDFSASGGSAELRNYFRHLSVGDVTATSEHLAEPLFSKFHY